jgi:hypothetical protein
MKDHKLLTTACNCLTCTKPMEMVTRPLSSTSDGFGFRLGSRCDDTPFISLNRYFAFTTSWLPSCMSVLSNLVVQTSRRYWHIWITVFSLWFGSFRQHPGAHSRTEPTFVV